MLCGVLNGLMITRLRISPFIVTLGTLEAYRGVALVVSKHYGIQLRADNEENHQIFRSLRHLAEYIAGQRTK